MTTEAQPTEAPTELQFRIGDVSVVIRATRRLAPSHYDLLIKHLQLSMQAAEMTARSTETLTDDMIRALRIKAEADCDLLTVDACDMALGAKSGPVDHGRKLCAEAITNARATDDSRPFVRVVA